MTGLLAFGAGALGLAAAAHTCAGLLRPVLDGCVRVLRGAAGALDALLRSGREGSEPGALERRRLLACGAAAAFGGGALVLGPLAGALLALAAPAAVSRALRARRAAYRRAVERGAPAIARALADALTGGHSLRGALIEASVGVPGAGGAELRRIGRELSAGESTESALAQMRVRCPSPSVDTLVAAALVQRRSGGDLAGLLRTLARSFEDERRLAEEVRVATAQARLTGMIVVVLPLGGGLLAELARPGFLRGMLSGGLTAWLVALALLLQLCAGILIRRIGRVRA